MNTLQDVWHEWGAAGLQTMNHEALLQRHFTGGLSYEAFKAALGNQAADFSEGDGVVEGPSASSAFRSMSLNVLAIVEDWCKDSKDSLPVLATLMKASRGALRVVHRDEHPELMAAYRSPDGNAYIPVYVFLDNDWRERARYVERPQTVAALRLAERQELAHENPEFAPATVPAKRFSEPTKSGLKAAIEEKRRQSRRLVSLLIANEFERLARQIQHGSDQAPTGPLSQPLEVVTIADDACEIPD
jgi:thiol-disulfide isomerase/thioredoxin